MNCHSHPEADEREAMPDSKLSGSVQIVRFHPAPLPPQRIAAPLPTPAEESRLTRICAEGAWFCKRCCKYLFRAEVASVGNVCPRCDLPMKWQNPIW